MRTAHLRLQAYFVVLPVVVIALLILPGVSAAEEGEGRPWGRLNKPSLSAPEQTRKNGYLGRYNPWAKGGSSSSDEPPRYRQRGDDEPSTRAAGESPFVAAPAYPPLQQYAPATPDYPNYGAVSGESYPPRPLPYSATPGFAPWNGGLNPDYGNYWNDPYNSLQPDRGIFWSDMWR